MNKVLSRSLIAVMVMAILWVVMSFCALAGTGKVTINLVHYVNNTAMELDTAWYTNSLGQKFTVTKFKYYIGNIKLRSVDGNDYSVPGYYLVNEEEPTTKQIVWDNVPEDRYTYMTFTLGVDSADNCTGLQSGALDPVNAMFWTWNTGYIFLKLEGKSPQSKSPGTIFEYHIGGFREPANSIRKIKITFPQPFAVKVGGRNSVNLKVDAAEILKTPTTIDFSELSSVTDAKNAPMVANNYMDMFSVIGID